MTTRCNSTPSTCWPAVVDDVADAIEVLKGWGALKYFVSVAV
jgi:hypothetical protein